MTLATNCIKCTQRGLLEFERAILEEIPEEERVRFAEENGARLREEYCQKYCQVTRFERRWQLYAN
jgi:hypothetical protein